MKTRNPNTLDSVAAAAATVFATLGFDRAKVGDIARLAGVASGTVYRYASGKDALFELVALRACESPVVADIKGPFRGSDAATATKRLRSAVDAIANFPQLWLAIDRLHVADPQEEYEAILLELANWLVRYRQAILLAGTNRFDRPALAEAFDQIIWRDLGERLTRYLESRASSGLVPPGVTPAVSARVVLDALAGTLVASPAGHAQPMDAVREAVVTILSGHRPPRVPDPREHARVELDPIP